MKRTFEVWIPKKWIHYTLFELLQMNEGRSKKQVMYDWETKDVEKVRVTVESTVEVIKEK